MTKTYDTWKKTRLKHISKNIGQYGANLSAENYLENGVRFLRTTDIQENGELIGAEQGAYVDKSLVQNYLLESGDILFSRSGTLGRSYLHTNEVTGDFAFAGYLVRFKLNYFVYPKFIFYVSKSSEFLAQIEADAIQTTISNFNGEKYGNIGVLIPPLKTQEMIAAFLDRKTAAIDTLIAKKQCLIQLLEEKRIALINQAITKGLNPNAQMKDSGISWIGEIPEHWEIKKLKFLASKIGSGITPTGGASVYQSQGIPFLRSQNIYSDGIRINDIAFISEQIHEQMSSSKVYPNDVLLNITGASIGRCSVVPSSLSEANVNQHVCIIRSNQKILPEILHNYLVSEKGQHQISLSENGVSREGLNFEQIKSFYVVKPSPSEQQEIAIWLDCKTTEIDALITKTRISIEKLQEYRRSLITTAVTGKLDVTQEEAS